MTWEGKIVNSINYMNADFTLETLYRQSLDYDFTEKVSEDKREWSWEDRQLMNIMDKSCISINGHYQVDLPLCDAEVKLPNNKKIGRHKILHKNMAWILNLKLTM